jgi:hypothetical protein
VFAVTKFYQTLEKNTNWSVIIVTNGQFTSMWKQVKIYWIDRRSSHPRITKWEGTLKQNSRPGIIKLKESSWAEHTSHNLQTWRKLIGRANILGLLNPRKAQKRSSHPRIISLEESLEHSHFEHKNSFIQVSVFF